MKTPYKNIYSSLRQNRWVVLATIIGAALTSTVAIVMMARTHRQAMENAFAIQTDGQVIPLKLVSQKENLLVEAQAHLQLFHTYFYHIDAGSVEQHLEKALWLGDSSVDELYLQKKADGVYNRLLQYSLVQRVLSSDSKINLKVAPYAFEVKTVFAIDRGQVTDTYELITTGKLLHVDRNFPHNPHGLLITDFFENSLRKIETDEGP